MKQKAFAFIAASAITLASATPAFAGSYNNNHHHHHNNMFSKMVTKVTQKIKVNQKGYKNSANIWANINLGNWWGNSN